MRKVFLRGIIQPGVLIAKAHPTVHLTVTNLLSGTMRKFIQNFVYFIRIIAPGLEQIPAPIANAFPPLQTKQTNPSPAWQYLKKDLDDYYRLKKAPVWQREQNLSALQNDIQCLYNQSPTKEQRQYLDALQIEIKPQVESLLTLQNAFSKEHTLYWALDYYDYRQWVQTLYVLQTLDQETLSQEWLLRVALMQATAFYHLHQFSDMIDAINRAYAIDAKTVENYLQHTESSHLQASYYSKGLEALQHSNAKDEDSFCQRMAIWAAKQLYTHVWEFNQWTCHYWALSSTKTRDFFREALQTLVDTNSSLPKGLKEFAEHIPDDAGNRLSVKKTRQDFHQALFSLKEKDANSTSKVEIRWLSLKSDGSYVIEQGYLQENYVKQLFDQNGYPRPNERQQEGRSLVKCLRDPKTGEAIAYLKFYPHQPLRQYAIDSLCARLSGYHAQTALAWIKHPKKPRGEAYPVLLSLPLGAKQAKQAVTLLHHQKKQNDAQFEQNIHAEAYTWKFFETLLMRPKDEKNDNVIPVPVPYAPNLILLLVSILMIICAPTTRFMFTALYSCCVRWIKP